MKTDFEKILEAIEILPKTTYRRILGMVPNISISINCFLFHRNVVFFFDPDNSAQLVRIVLLERDNLCAELEWSGDFAGARGCGEEIHLYANSDRCVKIDTSRGSLFIK